MDSYVYRMMSRKTVGAPAARRPFFAFLSQKAASSPGTVGSAFSITDQPGQRYRQSLTSRQRHLFYSTSNLFDDRTLMVRVNTHHLSISFHRISEYQGIKQTFKDTRSWLLSLDITPPSRISTERHLAFGAFRFVPLESRQLEKKE
jgi:hypothetical protein